MEISRNLIASNRTKYSQSDLNAVLLAHERFLNRKPDGVGAQLESAELAGLNLSQRNLQGADFAGANLFGASFARANLERASLYCADLRLADFRHANITAADLRGASLRGANLSCAILDKADLRTAKMVRPGVSMPSAQPQAQAEYTGVDFTNCSMKHASLSGAILKGANFTGALLQSANFKGARLLDVTFSGAVLTGVDLRELNVPAAALKDALTEPKPETIARAQELKARLDQHERWIETSGREGALAVLDGEDLRPLQPVFAGRKLTGISARNVVAVGVNFCGCQLQSAKFDNADLRDADFTGADLRAASFHAAQLAHARFSKADLRPLILLDGRQRATDLWEAVAQADQFSEAQLDRSAEALGLRTIAETEVSPQAATIRSTS